MSVIQLHRNTICVTLHIADAGVTSFHPFRAKSFSVLERRGCPFTPGTPKSVWAIL